MSDVERVLPGTGYILSKLWTSEIQYEFVASEEISETQEDRNTTYYWDWMPEEGRSPDEDPVLYVVLGTELRASKRYPENARVTMVGEFKLVSKEPTIPLRNFVMGTAPTMMFPFIRETIANLTGRGLFGSYYIAPFYLSYVLETDYSFEESSGFQTLTSNRKLAQEFGFTPESFALPPPDAETPAQKQKRKPRAKAQK